MAAIMHISSRPTRAAEHPAPASRRAAGRSAFTLVEIMIALTLLSILGAAAVTFLVKQTRAVTVICRAPGCAAERELRASMRCRPRHPRRGRRTRQPAAHGHRGQPVRRDLQRRSRHHRHGQRHDGELLRPHRAGVTHGGADAGEPDHLSAGDDHVPGQHVLPVERADQQRRDDLVLASRRTRRRRCRTTICCSGASTTRRRRVVARGLVFPAGQPGFRYFIPGAAVNSRVELTAPTLPLYFKAGSVGPDTMLAKISEIRVQLQAVYETRSEGDVYRSVNEIRPARSTPVCSTRSACSSPPQAPASLTHDRVAEWRQRRCDMAGVG